MAAKHSLTTTAAQELLGILQKRFEQNMQRHKGMSWANVHQKLEASPGKLWSLNEMEMTGGEPDVIGTDKASGALMYMDCAAESPTGRRSLCYDRAALDARKANKPAGSAIDLAMDMGVAILDEAQYRYLQTLGQFDAKTSSWIATPPDVRQLGGALFCDYRFGQVFTYHNGAESYYAARGFRCLLTV